MSLLGHLNAHDSRRCIFENKSSLYYYDFQSLLEDIVYNPISLVCRICVNIADCDKDERRRSELDYINQIQRELAVTMLPQSKAIQYDMEMVRLREELKCNNIDTNDKIEIVFWQDSFERFVSLTKSLHISSMTELFGVSSKVLIEAGFSPYYINTIINIVIEWYESKSIRMHSDEKPDLSNDVADDVVSMFFQEGDDCYV